MEYNAYKIETRITLLLSLLKVFAMLKMSLSYDNKNFEENVVYNIGITCNNCGKNWFICEKYQLQRHGH